MPIKRCQKNKKPVYEYGNRGHCYTYIAESKISRDTAYRKALKQTGAIKASQARRGK